MSTIESMTAEEVQQLYDTLGSIVAVAERLQMSRNICYQKMKEKGVLLNRRGGYRMGHKKATERRKRRENASGAGGPIVPGESRRIICEREGRMCVVHDYPGSCDMCKSHYERTSGINSLMEATTRVSYTREGL